MLTDLALAASWHGNVAGTRTLGPTILRIVAWRAVVEVSCVERER